MLILYSVYSQRKLREGIAAVYCFLFHYQSVCVWHSEYSYISLKGTVSREGLKRKISTGCAQVIFNFLKTLLLCYFCMNFLFTNSETLLKIACSLLIGRFSLVSTSHWIPRKAAFIFHRQLQMSFMSFHYLWRLSLSISGSNCGVSVQGH